MSRPIKEYYADPERKSQGKWTMWEGRYGPEIEFGRSYKDKVTGEWKNYHTVNLPTLRALAAKLPEVIAEMEVIDAEFAEQRTEFYKSRSREKRESAQPSPAQTKLWSDDSDEIPF